MEFCSKKKLQVVVLVRPIHLYHLSCQNADFFVSINQSYQVWIDLVSWKDLYSAFRFCSLLYLQWFWNFYFLSFCFFEMMMDQTIYELAFWTIFFPYPKPQKIIGSRFNCCGIIDTRLSMCFMLSMILVSKVIWTHQIYCHWMVYRV